MQSCCIRNCSRTKTESKLLSAPGQMIEREGEKRQEQLFIASFKALYRCPGSIHPLLPVSKERECLRMWVAPAVSRGSHYGPQIIFELSEEFWQYFSGWRIPWERSLFFLFFKETHGQEGTGSQTLDHLPFPLDFCHTSHDTRSMASTIAEASSLGKTLLPKTDWS